MKETRKLLVGPAGSGKTRALVRRFLARVDPATPDRVLVLTPDRAAADRFRVSAYRECDPARRGFPDGAITTFESFASRLLGLTETDFISSEEEALILLDRADDLPEVVSRSVGFPGYRGALFQWMEETTEAGIEPSELLAYLEDLPRRSKKLEQLARLLSSHRAQLKGRGKYRRSGLPWEAAAAMETGDLTPPAIETILVDGFHQFSPGRMEFLAALAARAPELRITLPSIEGEEAWSAEIAEETNSLLAERFRFEQVDFAAPGNVPSYHFLGGATREEELERIVKEIERIRVRDDAAYDDFLILFRNVGPYREAMESIAARWGTPFRGRFQVPLVRTAAGRALLELIHLLQPVLPISDWESILKNRMFAADPDAADRALGAWRSESLETGRERVEELQGIDPGFYSERVAPLLAFRAETLGARGAAFLKRVREWWEELLDDAPSESRAESELAARGVRPGVERAADLLARMEAMARELENVGAWSGPRLLPVLEQEIRRALVSFTTGGTEAILVDDMRHGQNVAARFAFLAGLDGDAVPRSFRAGTIWNEADREVLNDTGQFRVRDRAGHQAEERFLFRRAASRGSDRVYFSFSSFGVDGRERGESPFRSEFRTELGENGYREHGVIERYHTLDSIVMREDLPVFLAAHVAPAGRVDAEAKTAATLLAEFGPGVPDAPIDFRRPVHLGDHPLFQVWADSKTEFSISELEDYQLCPYRYGSRHVFRLGEPDPEVEFAFPPSVEGNVIHKTLEEVLGGGDFDEVFPRVFEEERGEYPGRIGHALAEQNLREGLRALIREDESIRSRYGWTAESLERRFGSRVKVEVALDKESTLSGRIDRIDRNGDSILVIDYKRSLPATRAFQFQVRSGRQLALPLYLHAAKTLTGLEPVGAFLLDARKGKRIGFVKKEMVAKRKVRNDWNTTVSMTEDEWKKTAGTAVKRGRDVVKKIRSGAFPVDPEDDNVCARVSCAYRDICRVVLAARESKS
ncbi:MAG: hypothetical protein HKN20_15045 [Gemmatimonadetes bacterium]|nr:hypothetical protein [Gemmatimonadota bacterium]